MRMMIVQTAGPILLIGLVLLAPGLSRAQTPATQKAGRAPAKPQTRPTKDRIKVDPATIQVDDGDSVVVKWPDGDSEIVRILGIDAPETRHVEHNIPIEQAFGAEAKAFAQGSFSTATDVQILRCATLDPYGRTLAYLYVNDKNYSVLIIKARLAEESVSFYGDNGFPEVAALVVAASKEAGPLPFESPHLYRTRMRNLSDWMKKTASDVSR